MINKMTGETKNNSEASSFRPPSRDASFVPGFSAEHSASPDEAGAIDRDPQPAQAERAETAASEQVAACKELLLACRALSLRTLQGPVFGPVDWEVPADRHGVVLGEQGSGRSAFLLALAGRMRGLAGSLDVGGIDGLRQAGQVRKEVAVARITDFAELEPLLTVAETIDERALMEGISVRKGRQAFSRLERAVDARFEYYDHIEELPAVQRTLLALLLGALRPARYIVVDDIDESLTADQLTEIFGALDILRELGHRYVVSALTTSSVPNHSAVLTLPPAEAAERLALSFGHLRPRRVTPKES